MPSQWAHSRQEAIHVSQRYEIGFDPAALVLVQSLFRRSFRVYATS